MLSKRVIPCLDVRDGKLTKGIKFQGNVDIGDPVETARLYYEAGADELVFYDITASSEGRGIMLDVVDRVAREIFIPFSVGGGISTVEDMRAVLLAGAEKISVNSAAVKTRTSSARARPPSVPNASWSAWTSSMSACPNRSPRAMRSSSTAAARPWASTPWNGPGPSKPWEPGRSAATPSTPTGPRPATN